MDVNKKKRKFLFPKSGGHQQNEFLQLIADRTSSSNPSNHFLPVDNEWRISKCKMLLDYQKVSPISSEIITRRYILDNCIPKEKVSIIADGNCLFRALGWWLSANEDIHQIIRNKLLTFMKVSSLCEKYVRIKHDQSIGEYISKKKIITVWGTDVELFSFAIWLETDIYVFKDNEWQKFSHKGFNPKRGKNVTSALNIYLHNFFFFFLPSLPL